VKLPILLTVTGLALAGASGYFAAAAIGQADEPVRTVTVQVTGAPGPPGPPGPAGLACIAGYSPAIVVFAAPGGLTRTYVCLEE
jgi:hypothetical protein